MWETMLNTCTCAGVKVMASNIVLCLMNPPKRCDFSLKPPNFRGANAEWCLHRLCIVAAKFDQRWKVSEFLSAWASVSSMAKHSELHKSFLPGSENGFYAHQATSGRRFAVRHHEPAHTGLSPLNNGTSHLFQHFLPRLLSSVAEKPYLCCKFFNPTFKSKDGINKWK